MIFTYELRSWQVQGTSKVYLGPNRGLFYHTFGQTGCCKCLAPKLSAYQLQITAPQNPVVVGPHPESRGLRQKAFEIHYWPFAVCPAFDRQWLANTWPR